MSEVRFRGGPAHGMTQQEYDEKYGKRITQLEDTVRMLRREVEALAPDAEAGRHFKQLMRAINENPMTKKQWERLLVTMRMVGMDSKQEDSNGE